jgi:YbbR domain-containing protein
MAKDSVTNKISQSKILWAALSLVGAVALWFFVSYTQYTPGEQSFPGVKVVFAGEEALKQNGLIITDIENTEVTVRLTGPSGELAKLTSSNLSASVNVSVFTEPSTFSRLPVTIIFPGEVSGSSIDSSSSPSNVAFRVDKLITKPVKVEGEFAGSVAENFIQDGDIEFEPESVLITGPERLLSTIDHAFVTLDNKDVSETLEIDSAYALRDLAGNSVVSPYIDFEAETVLARLPVSAKKTVPLKIELIEGGGAVASNVRITIEPRSIDISGERSLLDEILRIEIGTIDLASFELSGEWTFPVTIGEGLKNLDGLKTARVKAEIIDMEVRAFIVTAAVPVPAPQGFQTSVGGTGIEVVIRGKKNALDALTAEDIIVEADVTGITAEGTFTVPANIRIKGGAAVGAVGKYEIQITLSKR